MGKFYVEYVIKGVVEIDAHDSEEAEILSMEVLTDNLIDYNELEVNVLESD